MSILGEVSLQIYMLICKINSSKSIQNFNNVKISPPVNRGYFPYNSSFLTRTFFSFQPIPKATILKKPAHEVHVSICCSEVDQGLFEQPLRDFLRHQPFSTRFLYF